MSENSNQKTDLRRREFLKGLATVPVFGLFLVNLWQKLRRDELKRNNILTDLVQEKKAPAVISGLSDSKHLIWELLAMVGAAATWFAVPGLRQQVGPMVLISVPRKII